MSKPTTTAYSRIFNIRGGAAPNRAPSYQTFGKMGGIDQSLGDVTPIRVPSATQYGKFDEVGVIRGAEDRPTTTVTYRYTDGKSEIMEAAREGCVLDVHVHFGRCKQPSLFNTGWEKILVFENGRYSNYSLGDLGAFDQDEDAVIDETVDLSGEWFYEIVPITLSERAQTSVGQQVVDIAVTDSVACAECGESSDGCQKVVAVTAPSLGSPGVKAEVIYSDDGFVTAADLVINSLDLGQDASAIAQIGDNIVVASNDSVSIHYMDKDDLFNGVADSWTEVTTGFVQGPNDMVSLNAAATWLVGDAGYIYYSEDITGGVTVLDAGVTTSENLNAIAAYDLEHQVIVGDSNTVLYSTDGQTFSAVTGPDTVNTPNLISVWMLTDAIWLVGTDDRTLWYTIDSGNSWTQKMFYGSTEGGGGTGAVYDIVFVTKNVGYMAVGTGTAGQIFRSIDGGYSWYVLPEGAGSIPANDQINALAVCYRNANVVFAGGLADDAGDGIIIKGS